MRSQKTQPIGDIAASIQRKARKIPAPTPHPENETDPDMLPNENGSNGAAPNNGKANGSANDHSPADMTTQLEELFEAPYASPFLDNERQPKAQPMATGRWPNTKFNLDSDSWLTPRGIPFDPDRHPDLRAATYKALLWAKNYQKGISILLFGGSGVGKTALAKIVYRTFVPGVARFVNEPQLLQELKDSMDSGGRDGGLRAKIARLNQAKILFLDDIGTAATRSPDWVHEVYWQLLNDRFEGRRATFVTSNLPMDSFCEHVGFRAWSRLEDSLLTHEMIIDLFQVSDYRSSKFYSRTIDQLLDDGILE